MSTSDHTSGNVDMAGFDRYYADWHGKIEALNPNHNDGTYILVS